MKRKKAILFSFLIFPLLLSAGIYAEKIKEKTVISIGFFSGGNWDAPGDESSKILDDAIAKFQKMHPDVEIKYESGILKKDYSEWLSGKFLIGSEPDVFLLAPEDFNLFASKKALLNLSTLIDKDKSFKKENYYKAAFDFGKYEEIQYALPYECMPTLICANKTLLKEFGIEFPSSNWNWADFHEICRRVSKDSDKDGETDRFGVCGYTWRDAAYSNGVMLFDDKGTKNYVNARGVVNAVNFVYAIYSLSDGHEVSEKDFGLGKVAFRPMKYSEYKTYKAYPWRLKKYANFEWDCTTMPAGPDGSNACELDALLMGVSSRTRHKELAWDFLKTMTYDNEIQAEIFEYSDGVSPLKSVTGSYKSNYEMISANLLNKAMEQAVAPRRFAKYEEALAMLDDGVQNAINSQKNIQAALSSLHQKVNNYLMSAE